MRSRHVRSQSRTEKKLKFRKLQRLMRCLDRFVTPPKALNTRSEANQLRVRSSSAFLFFMFIFSMIMLIANIVAFAQGDARLRQAAVYAFAILIVFVYRVLIRNSTSEVYCATAVNLFLAILYIGCGLNGLSNGFFGQPVQVVQVLQPLIATAFLSNYKTSFLSFPLNLWVFAIFLQPVVFFLWNYYFMEMETDKFLLFAHLVVVGFVFGTSTTQVWLVAYTSLLEQQNLIIKKEAKQKLQFLTSTAHEIRTPLCSILGYLELTLGDKENISKLHQEWLTTSKESGEFLLETINRILDFQKLEHGKMELWPETFNLSSVLQQVCSSEFRQSGALSDEVELFFTLDEQIPNLLVGDSHHIRQVLTNLVGNSIKFTRRGFIHLDVKLESQTPTATAAAGSRSGSRRGDVAKDVAVAEEVVGLVTKPTQVSVGVDGTAAAAANSREITLAFHVVDSGLGISKESEAKLFSEFYSSNEAEGTGIGLKISRQLCHLMGGGLVYDGAGPGGLGSRFRATLKVKTSESCESLAGLARHANQSFATTGDSQTHRKIRLLGVEAARFQKLISNIVRAHGKLSTCPLSEEQLSQDEVVLINYFNMASTESLLRQTHAKGAKSVIVLARPSQFPSISKLKNTLSNTFSEGQLWIVKKPLVKAELLEAIVNFSQLEATQRASSRPGEDQPPSLTKQPAEEGSQPWKVLAVDDNSVNRKMITAMLKRIVIGGRKVDCVTAVDGVDAVAKVVNPSSNWDAILMDRHMPRQGGLEATSEIIRRLKAQNRPLTPVCCVSASSFPEDKQAALEAGMGYFLPKPFTMPMLKNQLETMIGGQPHQPF